jgi:pyruvate/2-oxoglutarate dehydrogenase complex dihydrolipoamide acyltransferase (E2) component
VPKAAATAAVAVKPQKPSVVKQDGDGYTDIELTGMRRTIAKRLTESKASMEFHFTLLSSSNTVACVCSYCVAFDH